MTVQGRRYQTSLRKMGAILGDNCELGCNTVTMPGALVGRNTLVYPNTTLRGFTPHDSVVKLRQQNEISPRQSAP